MSFLTVGGQKGWAGGQGGGTREVPSQVRSPQYLWQAIVTLHGGMDGAGEAENELLTIGHKKCVRFPRSENGIPMCVCVCV